MSATLAFDVYGTLINTSGVYGTLQKIIPNHAQMFMKQWRQKQLEYSFRRGLMDRHVDFSICTSDALNYCCEAFNVELSDSDLQVLLDTYTQLPAFSDVENCLQECQNAGFNVYAFSNGSADAVSHLLKREHILELFDGIVSTEAVQMFKPSPVVYQYFTSHVGIGESETWLISGNPFDVMGARACGWKAAWIQRSPETIFDPWGEKMLRPTLTVKNLSELPNVLSQN